MIILKKRQMTKKHEKLNSMQGVDQTLPILVTFLIYGEAHRIFEFIAYMKLQNACASGPSLVPYVDYKNISRV